MARSIQTIKQSILDEMGNQSALTGVDNPSAVAIYNLWAYITAVGMWILETLWDKYKVDVDNIAAAAVYGHEAWWVDEAFKFQYGDTLIIQTVNGVKVLGYAVIDPTKQIIKRASIKSGSNGNAFLKVASEDGSFNLIKLTGPQLSAFAAYVRKKMPAGSNIGCASDDPDLSKIYLTVYFDALLDPAVTPPLVEAAINNYYKNIEFTGIIYLDDLLKSIRAVTGVKHVKASDTQAKSSTGAYVPFDISYQTRAGYIIVDPAFPLSTTLTYVA